jgi:hypothetical protein
MRLYISNQLNFNYWPVDGKLTACSLPLRQNQLRRAGTTDWYSLPRLNVVHAAPDGMQRPGKMKQSGVDAWYRGTVGLPW